MRSGHTHGTDVRRGLDARALSEAVSRPGIDSRAWVMEGTVGTMDPASGTMDFSDNRAIWNDSAGVHVDVLLANGHHVTARYGLQAGELTFISPIRPGDPVEVTFPGGSLASPIITRILNSRSNRQPVDSARKPVFANDRVLLHAKTTPIDIRTAGSDGAPVRVLIEQDGTHSEIATRINHGQLDAPEQHVLGTTYRAKEDQLLEDLQRASQLLQAASSGGPVAVLNPGFTAFATALTAFLQQASANNSFLSDTVFLKK